MGAKQEEIYHKAAERLAQHVRTHRMRNTQERNILLQYVCSIQQPFLATDLVGYAQQNAISIATAYNTLQLFVSAQIIFPVEQRQDSPGTRYQLVDIRSHRMRMICVRCGREVELKDAVVRDMVLGRKYSNFVPNSYDITVYGNCKTCRSKRKLRNV